MSFGGYKPIHIILSAPTPEQDDLLILEKLIKSEPLQKIPEIISEAPEEKPTPSVCVSKNTFSKAFKIWLHFWGRNALYYCIISCLVGGVLSILYAYKIETDLNILLKAYIASSSILWFFLTPVALHQSLKQED